MPRNFLGSYKDVVKCLKKHMPLPYPVSIRKVRHLEEDEIAYCDLVEEEEDGKKKFKIRLDKRLTEDTLILTLLHEYAHAVCWDSQYDSDHHGPEWGLAFSKVWICFEKHYLDRKGH